MLTTKAKGKAVAAARDSRVKEVEAKARRVKPKQKEMRKEVQPISCASSGAMAIVPWVISVLSATTL